MAHVFERHKRPATECGLCCTTVEHLEVSAGGESILEDINLHIHCGEITAVIGPNGAGKTTLLRALLGLISRKGEVRFLTADGGAARAPRFGYVPQRLEFDRLAPMTVLDAFAAARGPRPAFFGASSKTRAYVRAALEEVDAAHLADARLGALSGGELQRVLLVMSLTPLPDVLLLDEPSSGVDEGGLKQFYSAVDKARRERDITVLLVSHDMAFVKSFADRVVLLDRRVRAVGAPAEVFGSGAYRELMAGGG